MSHSKIRIIAGMDSQQNTRPVLMITMLVIAVFFSMGSRAIFSPLMPSMQEELGINLSTVGTLFLLVSVSYGIAMLLSGFLTARIGHGKTIVTALAAISLGLALSAVATNLILLACGLILIGAGAGTYPPSGIVMINTKISLKRRNTAFAFHEIGPNMALLTMPLFVIVLEPWFGWRGVLFFMAAISGLSALAFLRWGAPNSGLGTAPNLRTLSIILRERKTILGMLILSAALSGIQGVYAMLPAFLVTEYALEPRFVNILLSLSRITGVVLLMRTESLINRFGRRRTIMGVLLFSALFTALIGIVKGTLISIVVVMQPALLTLVFPPLLSSIADIGEFRYQNLTYAVVITVGVSIGSGVAPALLGLFADLGLGWLGFIVLALYMSLAVLFLRATPDFGMGHGRE
jgi:predicted MFS family arabinose efflux permease